MSLIDGYAILRLKINHIKVRHHHPIINTVNYENNESESIPSRLKGQNLR